ncbi:hypothetical protein D3C81_1875200 [compost metagenome]
MQAGPGIGRQFFALTLDRLQLHAHLVQRQFLQRAAASIGIGPQVDGMHQDLGLALAVEQVGLRAMVETMQHAVARLPDFIHTLLHLLVGHTE